MTHKTHLNRWGWALILGAVIAFAENGALLAQQQAPWTGVIGDESEPSAGAFAGFSAVQPKALSADGRFLVFESDRTLVADDTNGVYDVFLRDRHTGQLQLVSKGTDGLPGNGHSFAASISANGRHVVFRSWASNFDPTDANGFADIYVRDLDAGTTTLVSVGPNGERSIFGDAAVARLSGDGRFVVFTANFNTADGYAAWLRDRDADGNGVLDEPGSATTTLVSAHSVGASDQLGRVDVVAISNDARYVAYTASTFDSNNVSIGIRLFLHDRLLGTTVRVDTPLPSSGDVQAISRDPDFSDAGELVYTSTAWNLVPGDADVLSDVFVYDMASGSQTRLQLTHYTPVFAEAFGTAISADGRYVAFTGAEMATTGQLFYNVYAFDRQVQASYDISLRTDGSRDGTSVGASISADGSAIAFMGGSSVIQQGSFTGGVYVATSLAVSPAEIDVPIAGGVFSVDVAVPADIAWKAKLVTGNSAGYAEFSSYTGVGPATIDVAIPANDTGGGLTYHLWLGSKDVTFHQASRPSLIFLDPISGTAAGGTPFQVSGFGFKTGATVTFDGLPAADLIVSESGGVILGVTPRHLAGAVPVVVTNPDGSASSEQVSFLYVDDTPPVLTATVTGPSGANGWYVGDVSVAWSVQEDESQLGAVDCQDITQTTDVASRVVSCHASSEGGDASAQVEIRRDATAPTIVILEPQAGGTYTQGQSVGLNFTCADATSGVSTCTANQSVNLDTETPGTFNFTVTATDIAGNQLTRTVTYTVLALSTLDAFPASGTYGGSAALRARLVTGDGPLANRTVTFYLDGVAAATATTSANGEANVTLLLAGRPAGTLSLRAEYAGDASTLAATSNTTTLTIARQPLRITAINSAKVYGQALPAFTAFAEGFVSGEGFQSLTGSLTFTTSASATSAPGMYPVTPSGVTSSNYAITFVSGVLTVNQAATSLTLDSTPNPNRSNQNVLLTATVAPVAPGAGVPTGTVEFRDNGVVLGSSPLVNGVATLTKRLKRGSHELTAIYAGDANFVGSSGSIVQQTN